MIVSLALSLATASVHGGILAEHLPRSVRLLDTAEAVVGSVLGGRSGYEHRALRLSRNDLQSMSPLDLEEEIDRLEETKPGIGVGVGLTIGGGTSLIVGLIMLFAGQAAVVVVIGLLLGLVGLVARHRGDDRLI